LYASEYSKEPAAAIFRAPPYHLWKLRLSQHTGNSVSLPEVCEKETARLYTKNARACATSRVQFASPVRPQSSEIIKFRLQVLATAPFHIIMRGFYRKRSWLMVAQFRMGSGTDYSWSRMYHGLKHGFWIHGAAEEKGHGQYYVSSAELTILEQLKTHTYTINWKPTSWKTRY
jgi:hypothetical protein